MQRVPDHRRVFVQLLLHEVAVVALPDSSPGQPGELDLPLDLLAAGGEEARAFAVHHGPVAVVQIGDAAGERGERERVGADEHFVVSEADRERRPVLRANDQLRVASEDHRQGVGAFEPAERRASRGDRVHAALQVQIERAAPPSRCRSRWRTT